MLLLWFLVIVAHASVDLWSDFFPFRYFFHPEERPRLHEYRLTMAHRIDYYLARTSELNEMLVAGAGLLFVWLKGRATKAHGTDHRHA